LNSSGNGGNYRITTQTKKNSLQDYAVLEGKYSSVLYPTSKGTGTMSLRM
jgi:hypothetical protein